MRTVWRVWRGIVGPTGLVAHELNLITARTDDELIEVMNRLGINVTREEDAVA